MQVHLHNAVRIAEFAADGYGGTHREFRILSRALHSNYRSRAIICQLITFGAGCEQAKGQD
jgi:hypothetical protein